jgi:DNA repair and recombination protein RAD52
MFKEEQLKLLNQELASNRIKSRSKGNINLTYLEGHDILETANRVFGFGNWSYKITNITNISSEINQNQNHVICYQATVQILIYNEEHTNNISREDVGFGTGIAKTLADAHEGGAKEAVTDSIKRAMRSFGNQFGNSLYSKDKNHQKAQAQTNTQNYQPAQQNYNNQPQNNQHQTPYQNQKDFTQLTNLGLTVIQQGDNLVVMGENVFANKDTIKANGFRWDGQNKVWHMQVRQAA